MNKYVLLVFILIVLFVLVWSYFYYQPIDLPNVELKTHLFQIGNSREDLYNPSFVEWNDSILCAARLGKKKTFIGSYNVYTKLDDHFQPSDWKVLDIPIPEKFNAKGKSYQYEDVRLFNIQNRLLSLQSFLTYEMPSTKRLKLDVKFHMSICEWDKDMNLLSVKHYDQFKGDQKNWFLFENHNKIYMITDFSPFRYYEVDPLSFELSNAQEFDHEFKGFRGCKVISVENNKIKCMAHQRNTMYVYYNFKIFDVDLENKRINTSLSEMTLRRLYGLGLQYPHMVQKVKGKYYLTVGIEDNQSMILEWKDI